MPNESTSWTSRTLSYIYEQLKKLRSSNTKIEELIGEPAVGSLNNTLFKAIENIDIDTSDLATEASVRKIQQRLDVADAYSVTEITDQAAEDMVKNHIKNVYGEVSAQAGGTASDNYIAAAIVSLNGVQTKLYRRYLYAGTRKSITRTDGDMTYTIQVPDTGYGFTELWRKRKVSDNWVHYCTNPQEEEQSITTLHPMLETYDQQGDIDEQDIIVTINPN